MPEATYSITDSSGLITVAGRAAYTDCPAFRREFAEAVKRAGKSIRLDLSGLEELDSSVLAVFLEARISLKEQGGDLVVAKASERAALLFKDAGLVSAFDVPQPSPAA